MNARKVTAAWRSVPRTSDGTAKAAALAAYLPGAKVRRRAGNAYLTATVNGNRLLLVWDADGRYQYAASHFNGRKVRNVSEAIRLCCVEG